MSAAPGAEFETLPGKPQIGLEPDPGELAEIAATTWAFVTSLLASREDAPPVQPTWEAPGDLQTPPPEAGRGFEEALARFQRGIGLGFDLTSPGFMAYVPSGGSVLAGIAALLASVTNPFLGHYHAAPGMVALEAGVLAWLCHEFGLPARTAAGVFTSGGSLSALTAIAAARSLLVDDAPQAGVMYVSADAHRSMAKAARAAGVPASAIRVVPVDVERRMDVKALEAQIAADRRRGELPFLVGATAGTTDTGAIDPLADIADVARRHRLWMHVDGCYGGLFQLTPQGRHVLAGIEAADSIALDPHKAFSLPAGLGCLLVRDVQALRVPFSTSATQPYLQDTHLAGARAIDFADHSLELTRPFRGLQLWLPLQVLGVGAFRAALQEKLDLAAQLADELAECPALELPWPVDLSVVACRPRAELCPGTADTNHGAQVILDAVNASRRIFLSSTRIDGRTALRACILTHRTDAARVREAAELITTHATAWLANTSRSSPVLPLV